MEEYYYGDQWINLGDASYEPYVINLVFSTIEVKLPTLLFASPIYSIKPKPASWEYEPEMAMKKAQLRTDTLNTFVSTKKQDFAEEAELCVLDAFFRFGVAEVGYSADWIDNPNADMPILDSDRNPVYDKEDNVIKEPKKLPKTERIYIKRLDAKNFRVGGLESGKLENCSWCGYWEYYRAEDIKANPNLDNVECINWSGGRSDDFVDQDGRDYNELLNSGDLIKIWKIWDNRSKKQYLIDNESKVLLRTETFKRLPIFDLRFHKTLKGWYPLPPTRNWKSPQDEINDSREQARNHRKRFTRKYLVNADRFEDGELEKLINGPDGTWAIVNGDPNTISAPVQDANLGQNAQEALSVPKDDFNIISGTSAEARGEADRITATQSNQINQKAAIRDSRSRTRVAEFLCKIGEEMLLLAEEKFTLPIWIKQTAETGKLDPGGIASMLTGGVSGNPIPNTTPDEVWGKITLADLSDESADFEVNVSIDSLSPVTNDDEKGKFLEFLAALNQYPEVGLDPMVVQELAYRIGYRNSEIIGRLKQIAQLMWVQKIEMLKQGAKQAMAQSQVQAPAQSNNMAQAAVAQSTPPDLERIRQQINGQQKNNTGGLQ